MLVCVAFSLLFKGCCFHSNSRFVLCIVFTIHCLPFLVYCIHGNSPFVFQHVLIVNFPPFHVKLFSFCLSPCVVYSLHLSSDISVQRPLFSYMYLSSFVFQLMQVLTLLEVTFEGHLLSFLVLSHSPLASFRLQFQPSLISSRKSSYIHPAVILLYPDNSIVQISSVATFCLTSRTINFQLTSASQHPLLPTG